MLASFRSAVVLVYLWFRLNALKRFNSKLTIFPSTVDCVFWQSFCSMATGMAVELIQKKKCEKMRERKKANIYRQFNLIKFRTFIVHRGQFSNPSVTNEYAAHAKYTLRNHFASPIKILAKDWYRWFVIVCCLTWIETSQQHLWIQNWLDTNVKKNRF